MAWGSCSSCGNSFATYHDWATHSPCGTFPGEVDITLEGERRNAQWGDSDAVMIHYNPQTGDIRYPGQHTHKLKEGYERRYLRNLQQVNRFERENKVCNHVMHFDKNGRDIQDWNAGSH